MVIEVKYASEEEADQVAALLSGASTRPQGALVERFALRSATAAPVRYRDPVTPLKVSLRSSADQLLYVSGGLSVPPEDQQATFGADPAAPKLLDIRYSKSRADDAYVDIHYRNHWFTIADTDVRSKGTFSLLLTIFSLQTTGAGAAPALTLPVSR
jgi:hypothetical protein